MDKNFNMALNDALEKEFAWLEDFNNPDEEYTFSKSFEENMNKIFNMLEYTYVSVGRRRIRKGLLAALIALLIFIATGCAAVTGYLIITWHETQNDSQGTMDVNFDIENGNSEKAEFQCSTPKIPAGYTVTDKQQDETTYYIEYSDEENNIIYYSQNSDVENMGLSIDNEDADFRETKVNGYKGYASQKKGNALLIWTDGIYLYTLQGTCEMEMLENMSKEIVLMK